MYQLPGCHFSYGAFAAMVRAALYHPRLSPPGTCDWQHCEAGGLAAGLSDPEWQDLHWQKHHLSSAVVPRAMLLLVVMRVGTHTHLSSEGADSPATSRSAVGPF